MKRWGIPLPVALFVVGFFLLLPAQPSLAAANGKLIVTVYEIDEEGERSLLPGAQVILTDADGKFPQTAQTTNANGQAVFGVVPAGKNYIVTVKFPGAATTRRDGVEVYGKQTSQVAVAVTPERVEEVEVKGREKVIELEKGAQTETEVSGEFFQDLPVQGREYQNVLTLAAGVQDIDGDGNPNVHGSRETEFQANVDGVSNVDPLTGGYQSQINPDAIEEVRIVDSGADASFGGAIGGYAEIITKEGGNEFDGTFNLFFRDDAFDNDRAGGNDPLDFGILRPSIYLSGPIVKDHLWYMLSHELFDAQLPVDLIGGPDFTIDQKQLISLDKISWQVTPKNKLQLTYSADPIEIEPFLASPSRPPQSAAFGERYGPTFSLKWTSPFSPTFFWEATVAKSDIEQEISPFQRGVRNRCVAGSPGTFSPAIDPQRFLTGECQDLSQGNRYSGTFSADQYSRTVRWTYRADAEQYISDWLGGQHRITFGVRVDQSEYQQDLIQRGEFQRTRRGGVARNLDLNANTRASVFQVNHTRYFPERTLNSSNSDVYAVYLQDSYEPMPNLRLNVGVRISREELSSKGFEPFDPRQEYSLWRNFLLGSSGTPDSPSPDGCFSQLTQTGIPWSAATKVRLCRDFFSLENNRLVDEDLGITLDKTGSFSFIQQDLREDETAGDASLEGALDRILENYGFIFGNDPGAPPAVLAERRGDFFTIANNSIAPRLSVAWDPWDDGKTKVSAGWNRFYQNTILQPLVDELGPYPNTVTYATTQDNVPASASVLWGNPPPSVAQRFSAPAVVDRQLERAYSDQFKIGIEREIAPETTLTVRYENRKTTNQLQDTDTNRRLVTWDEAQQVLPQSAIGRCNDPIQLGGVAYADCYGEVNFRGDDVGDGRADLRPLNPYWNRVMRIGNLNESTYEAYIVELERRYYRNWELRASYTWSEALGEAEAYSQSLGDDPGVQDDEFGPLANDVRHTFKVSGRLLVPWYGGVRLGGRIQYRTGTPYSIVERELVRSFPPYWDELLVPQNERALNNSTGDIRTTYPTGQRNDQRNPGRWTVAVNAQKEFMIRDVRATVQLEIFNLLNDNTRDVLEVNRVEYDRNGNGTTNDPSDFLDIPVVRRYQGRSFQLAVKLDF